jgi:Ring finger domain/Sel1 repeat
VPEAHWKDHKPHCVDREKRAPAEQVLPKAEHECIICLFEIDELTECKLPCGHDFHVACVNKLRKSSDKCPICRAPIPNLERMGKELVILTTADTTVEAIKILPKPIQDKIIRYMITTADMGDLEMAYNLALYSSACGVDPCNARYFKYLLKAAKMGNRNAQYRVASIYLLGGYDVSTNLEEAKKWYKLSASQGCVDSQFSLGVGHLDDKRRRRR